MWCTSASILWCIKMWGEQVDDYIATTTRRTGMKLITTFVEVQSKSYNGCIPYSINV
jgi:hypothetical protein